MSRIAGLLPLGGQRFMPLLRAICCTQTEVALDPTKAEGLLFNDRNLEQIWNEVPFRGGVFARTIEEFKMVVKSYGSSRMVRVLELNAGHGCLTKAMGNAIKEATLELPNLQIEYYCADLDLGLAERSAKSSPWQPVSPVSMTFSGRLDLQGIPRVDIVVGLNALYTFPTLKIGLLSIESILLPGGFLMLIEFDRRAHEGITPVNFVFGGLKGWFDSPDLGNEDGAIEYGRKSAREIFRESGYLDPWFIEIERPQHVCHRTLITRIPHLSGKRALNHTHAQPLPKVLITIPEGAIDMATATTGRETGEVSEKRQWVDSFAYHYHFGEDAALMKFIGSLDAQESVKLVLYTMASGQNSNALIGISRAVRQEFPKWGIQLIIFDQDLGGTRLSDFLFHHLPFQRPSTPPELYIKKGEVCWATELRVLDGIDRKIPPRDFPYAWKEDHEPWAHYPPQIGEYDVEIQVHSLQKPDSQKSAFGFSGKIRQKGQRAIIPTGTPVVGVSLKGPMASTLVCHCERISKLPPGFHFQFCATAIRSMVTCDLIMEKLPELIRRDKRILIHGGPPGLRLGTAICLGRILYRKGWVIYFTSDNAQDIPCNAASFRYSTIDPDIFVREVKNHTLGRGLGCMIGFTKDHILLSLSLEILWEAPANIIVVAEEGTIHSVLNLPGQKPNQNFTFINPEKCMQQNYHLVPDAVFRFTAGDGYTMSVWDHEESLVALDLTEMEPEGPILRAGVVRGTPAFNPRATYVLVEGICCIGLAMAKFIIEHGGLHVVVTYGSYQNSMETDHNSKERSLFDSLRELPGVTIKVACVQAKNIRSMRVLFDNQEPPVAGVIWFSPTHEDTAARVKDQKNWDRVYSTWAATASILLDSLDVRKLEWLVYCSSFSSMTGQSGRADICGAQAIVRDIITRFENCTNVVIPPIIDQDPFLFPKTAEERADTCQNYTPVGMRTIDICKCILDAIWCMPKSNMYIPDMGLVGLTKYGLSRNFWGLGKAVARPKSALPDHLFGVAGIVSQTLRISQDEVTLNLELSTVGMDTSQAMQLSQRLESKVGLRVPYPKLFVPGLTLGKLLQEASCSGKKERLTSLLPSFIGREPLFGLEKDVVMRGNLTTEGVPIFIIFPPTIPTSIAFAWLASLFPLPTYILPSPQHKPDSCIEAISENYFHQILITLQYHASSVHLVSFSYSSPIVLSLTERLLYSGHKVESLVFLDYSPSLIYSSSFNSFMGNRISSNYWQDLILDHLEDIRAIEPSLGLISDILQQAKEFFDGNLSGKNKWCFEYLDTYINYAKILHKASTVVLNGSQQNPWECVEQLAPKVFLAKAKRGIVTEPWFCDDGIDKNWGIPAVLDPIIKEYDCGHCGILSRQTDLVESLRVFWGVGGGSERDAYRDGGYYNDTINNNGIRGV
ncbi:unnamed protein product [Tuber aestivum]|uniref:Ketoreductase domain-containing protein n=1 Tax=Tuber aestivum TaxID=59557 RepID=A0A292Q8J5_9PEZI|nr:unnamed protein product [Tuber aestivum]